MKRAVWLLALLLIANSVCNWRMTQWKVNEIKQASEGIDNRIDETIRTLEQIRKQMQDDEEWHKAQRSVKSNLPQ